MSPTKTIALLPERGQPVVSMIMEESSALLAAAEFIHEKSVHRFSFYPTTLLELGHA